MARGRPRCTTTTSRTSTRSTRSRRCPAAAAACSQVAPASLPYPPLQNPSQWYTFNYGTQRNTWGGNGEFSGKTPWLIRADYNEVKQNGIKPSSGQLGTGSGNGLIELGAPVDYKTQNTTIEGGYNTKQYGFKLAFLDSKFSDANDSFQWTNFYMKSGLDQSLLPSDNELKKWSFNGYIKQLPWDSAIIVALRAEQDDQQLQHGDVEPEADAGVRCRPASAQPPGVGYLVTQPYDSSSGQNISNFDGNLKRTTANVAWNASPMAQLDTRVYYNYYDLPEQLDQRVVPAGQPGYQLRERPPVGNSATCFTIAAARRGGRRGVRLHEERGRVRRIVVVQPQQQAAGRLRLGKHRPQPRTMRRRATTTGTGSSTATPAGRISPAA